MQMYMAPLSEAQARSLPGDYDGLMAVMEGPGAVDLDWAWDGVRHLLAPEAGGVDPMFGGAPLDAEATYGPVMFTPPAATAALAERWGSVDRAELERRFDPEALAAAGAYPPVWNRPEEIDGTRSTCVDVALDVIDLYTRAAAANQGVAVALM
jgi:hypothetical protein